MYCHLSYWYLVYTSSVSLRDSAVSRKLLGNYGFKLLLTIVINNNNNIKNK